MKPSLTALALVLILAFSVLLSMPSVHAASRTIEVNETDFVRLIPQATDPDLDPLTYYFSPPLDERGEWQTTFNDEGEYNITITAGDGTHNTTSAVLLIVHHLNQPPSLTDNRLMVKETQTIDLKLLIDDPDDDPLEYSFPPPFNKDGLYTTAYNDSGTSIISFNVSDGSSVLAARVEITIEDTNQPPEIILSFDNRSQLYLREGDLLSYFVELSDEDPSKLTILWTYDNRSLSDQTNGTYLIGYDESGDHLLSFTASDGLIQASRTWQLHIENTNRPPLVSHSDVIADEGDNIILNFPETDDDGDPINYTFSPPFTSLGHWQTTYDDAGFYNATITASDQSSTTTATISITVRNVDRPPRLTLPKKLYVNEGDLLLWTIDTADPDGDNLTINITGLPPSAAFDTATQTLSWTPDFDQLRRRGGLLSDILNTLRLERYIIRSRTIKAQIESCGKRWCSQGTVLIKIYNTNRPPQFNISGNFTTQYALHETQTISLNSTALDPDGDILHYYYTAPFERGKWTPGTDDEGTHTIYVTATDGQYQDTIPVHINVTPLNRQPQISLPRDDFTILEGQNLLFRVTGSDPDGDNLTMRIEDLPPGASFRDGYFNWTPSHLTVENKTDTLRHRLSSLSNLTARSLSTDRQTFFMRLGVSDGQIEVIHPVKITVANYNLPPTIVSSSLSTAVAKLGEPVTFELIVSDPDPYDTLQYSWFTSWREPRIHNTPRLERIFQSPGRKSVSIRVSDGADQVRHTFDLIVTDELYEPLLPPPPTYKVFVIEHS